MPRFSLTFAVFAVFASLLAVPAHAQEAGSLVKLPDDGDPSTPHDSAVYYVGHDGKRYVFPNDRTYFSWYADFSKVKVIDAAALANLPVGGNVRYRPGTRLVKIVTDPTVYAVEPNGVLRAIASEAVAAAVYGPDWAKRVDDLSDAFFLDYAVGEPLETAVVPDGSVVLRLSDGAVFLIENGAKRRIADASVRNALRIRTEFIIVSEGDLSSHPDGASLAFAEPHLADTAQLGPSGPGVVRERLEVLASSLHPDTSFVSGTRNAAVFRFDLLAASGTENRVTSMTLRAAIDEREGGFTAFADGIDNDDGTPRYVRDHLPSIGLYDASGALVAGPVTVTATGEVAFTGLGLVLPAGSTRSYALRGDLAGDVSMGTTPDLLAFDLVAISVEAPDGSVIGAGGLSPNGGTDPVHRVSVAETGRIAFAWKGKSGFVIAGRRVLIGTLEADVKDDAYDLTEMSFRTVGRLESVSSFELELGGTSVALEYPGADIRFQNLPFVLPRNQKSVLSLYAVLKPKDGDRWNERIEAETSSSLPVTFVSRSIGRAYGQADLQTDPSFTLASLRSDLFVRFSLPSFVASSDAPAGTVPRGEAVAVLRFGIKAEPEGDIHVSRLTFKLEPGDAGLQGPDNDALERWADLNGDAPDDNDVADLWPAGEADPAKRVGEGESASAVRIRYAMVRAGVKDETPQGIDSGTNDHGLLTYTFEPGGELVVPAGTTRFFRLDLATDAFAFGGHDLRVTVLGGQDLAWRDHAVGTIPATEGVVIPGLPLRSAALTVP